LLAFGAERQRCTGPGRAALGRAALGRAASREAPRPEHVGQAPLTGATPLLKLHAGRHNLSTKSYTSAVTKRRRTAEIYVDIVYIHVGAELKRFSKLKIFLKLKSKIKK